MPAPIHTKLAHWIADQFWDTTGPAREGFWGRLHPAWKLITAIFGSALLDWVEWAEHHPPNMAIIALIHFAFVVIAISIVIHVVRWLRPSEKA
jgi:hypothetical protein